MSGASLEARMRSQLAALAAAGNQRELREMKLRGLFLEHEGQRYLNLSSNDYLGLASSPFAGLRFEHKAEYLHGYPSSRLMTGNGEAYQELEQELRLLYPQREAVICSCGFMANCGLMPALAEKHDLILADKLVHASLIDGLKLSPAPWRRFRHNDCEHLESLLRGAEGKAEQIWVVVESLYSMDGDAAPLAEIVELKQRYGFHLIVDEAHAFGVRGSHGRGLCAELGLVEQVDIIMCTFGKALAGAGACLICSPLMRDYLVNRMRSLIFTTALPPATLYWVGAMVRELRGEFLAKAQPDVYPSLSARRAHLAALVEAWQQLAGMPASSHIIPIFAGSNERALRMAHEAREAGYWLTAIRPPTVPEGSARLRLSLHAGLSMQQVEELAILCKRLG